MNTRTILEKLKSRKLWAAIVGVIVGVAMIFGVDAGAVSDVAGAVTAAASIVAYILGEAQVDAAHKGDDPESVEKAEGE